MLTSDLNYFRSQKDILNLSSVMTWKNVIFMLVSIFGRWTATWSLSKNCSVNWKSFDYIRQKLNSSSLFFICPVLDEGLISHPVLCLCPDWRISSYRWLAGQMVSVRPLRCSIIFILKSWLTEYDKFYCSTTLLSVMWIFDLAKCVCG